MKKILLMAVMVLTAATASAQYEKGAITLQPKLGGNSALLTGTKDRYGNYVGGGTAKLDKETRSGSFIGVEAEYMLTKKLGLTAELNYSEQGMKWDDADDGRNYIRNVETRLNYINMPFTAKYYVWKGLAVKAGLQFGYLVYAKNKMDNYQEYMEGPVKVKRSMDVDNDIKSDCKKFDVAIPIGVSYEFCKHWVIDARYNIGLTKVNKQGDSMKNGVFTLAVGYKFRLVK